MQPQDVAATLALFATALSKVLLPFKRGGGGVKWWMLILSYYGLSAGVLASLGQSTAIVTAICWRFATVLLSLGTLLLVMTPTDEKHHSSSSSTDNTNEKSLRSSLSSLLQYGGPLGKGCAKVMEVVAGCLLWKMTRGSLPNSITATFSVAIIFDQQSDDNASNTTAWWLLIAVIIVLSLAVNGVLYAWSYYTKSNGTHEGLNQMVQPTVGRTLSTVEHVKLAGLALINAICEECTARGFWRREFELSAHMSSTQSNMAQALVFGVWHYHGVPSGLPGVVLTTVYGLIMGLLADWRPSSGLLLPVIAHSIADYYIFAVLVRQKQKQ